jgi:hypothetical protein
MACESGTTRDHSRFAAGLARWARAVALYPAICGTGFILEVCHVSEASAVAKLGGEADKQRIGGIPFKMRVRWGKPESQRRCRLG